MVFMKMKVVLVMNKDEFKKFKEAFLYSYRKAYKKATNEEKRLLKQEINKNTKLSIQQKDKLWELIVA